MPYRRRFGSPVGHIINRGVDKRWIFEEAHHKEHFVHLLGQAAIRHKIQVHIYVVMSNHYHLMARGETIAISKMMHQINQGYSRYYNRLHSRSGTLFEGRFKSFGIRSTSRAIDRSRYMHLNPVAATASRTPEEYTWSSIHAYMGDQPAPPWLDIGPILQVFSSDVLAARKRYGEYLLAGIKAGPKELPDGAFVDEPEDHHLSA